MNAKNRVALFLDGTWNTVDDNTNVWRMKALCAQSPGQISYYSAGVGTQYGSRVLGGMFGEGFDDEVTRAYEWLIENYTVDSEIFIFGFSRGAFTARSLAGFISKCGLLKVGSPISVKQLYERYRKGNSPTILALRKLDAAALPLEDRLLKTYSAAVPIKFQGVWDTVGALGIPVGMFPVVSRSNYAFLETDLRINQDYAYHALAIDEHREAFAPTLWKKSTPKVGDTYKPRAIADVEQRWFCGAHANVGGGYPNDLLAQIPLKWLMGKAESHGLKFTSDIVIDGDVNKSDVTNSFRCMAGGFYRLIKFGQPYFRTIGTPPIETAHDITTTINETIDDSVFDRYRASAAYRPQNLVDWASAHGKDPAALNGAVRADDASKVDG